MMRATLIASLLGMATMLHAETPHAAQGLIISTDPAHATVTISCQAIPGYMAAMEMPFQLHDRAAVSALHPGMMVRFTIVDRHHQLFAEKVEAIRNYEPEPVEAGTLQALSAINGSPLPKPLAIGEVVPDFTLTDQLGKQVSLASLRGEVVVLTFGYSRCPNPAYCLRLSSNLRTLAQRFASQPNRDVALLTIAIDPEYDQGKQLQQYAQSYNADPRMWHFLTGPVAAIRHIAALFDMNFWNSDAGLLTHTLRTVLIDRHGRLAAVLDGNAFNPRQLGDLVQSVLHSP